MTQARYSVIFAGQIVEGADPATVKANLAKLFKVDADRVETMFSGKPVLIKKDLDAEKAKSYRAALMKAGAAVTVVADESDAPAPTPAAASASTPKDTGAAESVGNEPPAPPQAPDLTVAEVGVTLVEHTPAPPPDFDTTQFDLAEVGVTLIEPTVVPPAEFDTSGMTLDPPGTQLTEPKPVPPADFDTSGLSLADNE